MSDNQISRADLLGVQISAINMQQALATIDEWLRFRQPNYICVTSAHGVIEAQEQPELRHILNQSGLSTPDGMSIVWLLKLMGHRNVGRVYGPDLMLAVCEQSIEKGYRHYLFGGAEGVADKLAAALQTRFPGLQIAGTYCPPFHIPSPEEDQMMVDLINQSGADIVWVGISTPKQERWMASHLGQLEAPVMVGVGAAFDFLSGVKRQAPRWIQRSGLEWLFRLANEPRRLWPRYIQYPGFILKAAAQLLGSKNYPS
ncbi:MAG: WecB/TagA/CpsF family glycosyltransferase [Anaerolineales bacterium]|nr:WecB/TagA/CpsF family glycosyltransferase [Anaerolineales bacterium]